MRVFSQSRDPGMRNAKFCKNAEFFLAGAGCLVLYYTIDGSACRHKAQPVKGERL